MNDHDDHDDSEAPATFEENAEYALAIHAKCFQCRETREAVEACPRTTCPLWELRPRSGGQA
jgi:hypothetical protein